MQHALIIEEDGLVSSIVEEKLSDYGFTSFSHVWTDDDAIRAVRVRRPDLVIVCDGMEAGPGISTAHSISERYGIPALIVTGERARLKTSLPKDSSLGGPFLIGKVSLASGAAKRS